MRIAVTALAAALMLSASVRAQAPGPYAQLPGTAWIATEWGGAKPTPPYVPRIAFNHDYGFSGGGGCNRFSGRYGVDGERITLDPAGWTKKMCHDGSMVIDLRLGEDLRNVTQLIMSGDGILSAHGEDGRAIFRFRRARPEERQ